MPFECPLRPSRTALTILSVLLAAVLPALAAQHAAPPASADELLRQAVAREKSASKEAYYYVWTDRLQKPRGATTKLMVTTPQGILSRAVAINDRALTADERTQDDQRINRLLDPSRMSEKAAKQREDAQHIQRVLAALPDAFHCEFAATVPEGRDYHLDCAPRPGYSPQNYESQVLQGMKATILLDRQENRIVRIDGTLFKDVNFGWGFLGRLNRGGRIEIVQTKIAPGHWNIQKMALVFDGRVIVVKPIHIEETELCWDYRPVPAMSVSQALDFLRAANFNPKPH
ncbi:MAG: hypothetical protein P4M01_04965 [Acidobacteriota bacterium]|nr:hypothetical protein [Acidobacteriota bacterium]